MQHSLPENIDMANVAAKPLSAILRKQNRRKLRRDQLAESIRKADKEYRSGKMLGGPIEEVLKALND